MSFLDIMLITYNFGISNDLGIDHNIVIHSVYKSTIFLNQRFEKRMSLEMKQPIDNIRWRFEIRGIMTLNKMGMVL